MNPYLILAAVIAWGASVGAAGWVGFDYGESSTIAGQKKADDYARAATEAATKAAAAAIAKIRPQNTTIQQETRREIETHTVYRDCRVTPDGVRLANQALTGRPQPTGDSKLPATDAAVGRLDGGAAGQAGGDR